MQHDDRARVDLRSRWRVLLGHQIGVARTFGPREDPFAGPRVQSESLELRLGLREGQTGHVRHDHDGGPGRDHDVDRRVFRHLVTGRRGLADDLAPPPPQPAAWPCRGWPAAARRWRRAPGRRSSPFLGARVNSGARSSLASSRSNTSPSSSITPASSSAYGRLVAEPLDVEGAPAGDVEDPLEHLGRAVLVVGAAQVLVALLLLRQRRCRRTGTRSASPTRLSPSGRSASTGPTISGITSPALRRTTVSPGRTSLRLTSWALCRVALSTVEPATWVGSITPNGVTRPVRPVLTSIASSLALTSSGGYLNAIAQRGARLVEPSRRCSADVVDLDHHAVDLVGRRSCGGARRRSRCTPRPSFSVGQHPDLVGGRQPPGRERVVGRATAPSARTPRGRRCRGRPCRARGWR